MSKRKVHYVSRKGVWYCSTYGAVNSLQTSHNVDEVTCKHCKKTELFKRAVMRAKKKKAKEAPIEKSYAERQEDWIKENDIQVGDEVRVTRVAKSYEDGWCNSWAFEMKDNEILAVDVTSDPHDHGMILSDGFAYPYFVLEKVVLDTSFMVGADCPTDVSKEDPTESIREFSEDSIAYQFLDNLLNSVCGGQELRGYQYVEFNPREGYSILREDKDKNPRIFRVVVQEMELTEKRRHE